MRTESNPYERMPPPSTQNLKALGRLVSKRVEMAMSRGAKFEVVKFDGHGNFRLWQTRAKDLLAQQRLLKTLKSQKPAKMEDED